MIIKQYDLFEDVRSEKDMLKEEIQAIKDSSDKVRKGIFAKHGQLAKMYLDINNRLEIIERNICKGVSS